MNYTVYMAYNRRVVFEGSAAECWAWLVARAQENCGVFRTWRNEAGDTLYDMGYVYIYNGPQVVVNEK